LIKLNITIKKVMRMMMGERKNKNKMIDSDVIAIK